MLLRSLTKHVREQNWFAVGIDFLIVIVGILIAFQITTWKEDYANRTGLQKALERLDKEVSLNIEISDLILQDFAKGTEDLNFSRDALSRCESSSEATAALERTIYSFVEDYHPNFVVVVLEQLSAQERYQDILSAEFQQSLGFYIRRLKEEYEQTTTYYNNAWSHHITHHPSVRANFVGSDQANWSFSLAKPFNEVCQDNTFRNRFINTIGFLGAIEQRLQKLNIDLKKFQDDLKYEIIKNQ